MITKKIDSNTIWENAEKLASFINEAYLNFKKSEVSAIEDEKFNVALDNININLDKRAFVRACEIFGRHLPYRNDLFPLILKEVLSLPLEDVAENKELTFEMFITCLHFHLAFYKKEWEKE